MVRRVVGVSMLPSLPPGRIVFAIGRTRCLRKGSVVICTVNGREVIKRVVGFTVDDVYIAGDNRQSSTDSRDYGPVARKQIRAVVIWPKSTIT